MKNSKWISLFRWIKTNSELKNSVGKLDKKLKEQGNKDIKDTMIFTGSFRFIPTRLSNLTINL